VLFKRIRLQDATPTYVDYGIELGLRDNYYTLPKRDLSIILAFVVAGDTIG
jgi:hypothetical protein